MKIFALKYLHFTRLNKALNSNINETILLEFLKEILTFKGKHIIFRQIKIALLIDDGINNSMVNLFINLSQMHLKEFNDVF